MPRTSIWSLVERHPYRVAVVYLLAQVAFVFSFRGALGAWRPEVLDATWQDPRVLTLCFLVAVGSILTVYVSLFLRQPHWLTEDQERAAKAAGLHLYPIVSGFSAAVIVPASILFYVVHGPLLAIIVFRGTGFVVARIVDELMVHRKISPLRVTRRQDLATMLAAMAVWLGIVIPSKADPSPSGQFLTQAWLVAAFVGAYSLRLWCINVFNVRWLKHTNDEAVQTQRMPVFIWYEQATLAAIMAVVLVPAAMLFANAEPNFVALVYRSLPYVACGVPLGISAILAISLLLVRDRTASHNFTLYRITGSLATFIAAACLWAAFGLQPTPQNFPLRDGALAFMFVLALFVLHGNRIGDNTHRDPIEPAAPAPPPDPALRFWRAVRVLVGKTPTAPALPPGQAPPATPRPPRYTLRFVRFLLFSAVLLFIAPSTHSALYIVGRSAYSDNVNTIAVISEVLYSSVANALPVFAILGLLFFIFQTAGAPQDAAHLVDHNGAGVPAEGPISLAHWHRIDTAAKRLTLAVGVMSGLIALGAWMQTSVTGRSTIERSLTAEFASPAVIEGRRLIRQLPADVRSHDSARCPLCETLRAYVRGDSLVLINRRTHALLTHPSTLSGDHSLTAGLSSNGTAAASAMAWATRAAMGPPLEDPQDTIRVTRIVATLNAVEAVLDARRTGALSEIEFHAVWAGVVCEVLDRLQAHLDGDPVMYENIRRYLPMLCQQMSTRPWLSDSYAASFDSVLTAKRDANHHRPHKP